MVNEDSETKINAQITIIATYDDSIRITISDRDSSTNFVTLELTREQFINAAMNRLGNCDVKHAVVRSLYRVGKVMEMDTLEFPIISCVPVTYENRVTLATQIARMRCGRGWIPDTGFNLKGSFFTKDGEPWARTTIRRWVEKEGDESQ